MAFTFNFSPDQPHQVQAIASVVDLFVGLDKAALAGLFDEIVLLFHLDGSTVTHGE